LSKWSSAIKEIIAIDVDKNQLINADLHTKTDLVDWAILNYIHELQFEPNKQDLQHYVKFDYELFIKEMPLLGLNTKQLVSARITKLSDLKLLENMPYDETSLFIKLTDLFYKVSGKSDV
jgi:hypothetical protein